MQPLASSYSTAAEPQNGQGNSSVPGGSAFVSTTTELISFGLLDAFASRQPCAEGETSFGGCASLALSRTETRSLRRLCESIRTLTLSINTSTAFMFRFWKGFAQLRR